MYCSRSFNLLLKNPVFKPTFNNLNSSLWQDMGLQCFQDFRKEGVCCSFPNFMFFVEHWLEFALKLQLCLFDYFAKILSIKAFTSVITERHLLLNWKSTTAHSDRQLDY